jgi:hypothetical protein
VIFPHDVDYVLHCPMCFRDLLNQDEAIMDEVEYFCPTCGARFTPGELERKVHQLLREATHESYLAKLHRWRISIVVGFLVTILIILLVIVL